MELRGHYRTESKQMIDIERLRNDCEAMLKHNKKQPEDDVSVRHLPKLYPEDVLWILDRLKEAERYGPYGIDPFQEM